MGDVVWVLPLNVLCELIKGITFSLITEPCSYKASFILTKEVTVNNYYKNALSTTSAA